MFRAVNFARRAGMFRAGAQVGGVGPHNLAAPLPNAAIVPPPAPPPAAPPVVALANIPPAPPAALVPYQPPQVGIAPYQPPQAALALYQPPQPPAPPMAPPQAQAQGAQAQGGDPAPVPPAPPPPAGPARLSAQLEAILNGTATHGSIASAVAAAQDLLAAVVEREQRGLTVTVADFGDMFRRELYGLPGLAQIDLKQMLDPIFAGHYMQKFKNAATLAATVDHYEVIKQDDDTGE